MPLLLVHQRAFTFSPPWWVSAGLGCGFNSWRGTDPYRWKLNIQPLHDLALKDIESKLSEDNIVEEFFSGVIAKLGSPVLITRIGLTGVIYAIANSKSWKWNAGYSSQNSRTKPRWRACKGRLTAPLVTVRPTVLERSNLGYEQPSI
jgi:hypothetical protein